MKSTKSNMYSCIQDVKLFIFNLKKCIIKLDNLFIHSIDWASVFNQNLHIPLSEPAHKMINS